MDDLKKKSKFDLEISIIDAIEYHNNRELSSTGFKPVEIRNTEDKDLINQLVLNIIKSMKRKIDKFKECVPNTLLLICEDVELHGNRYLLKKK